MKSNSFDAFDVLLIVIFGILTELIYFCSKYFFSISDGWQTFVFDACLYFFFTLMIWLDKSRSEKEGVEFWPTFLLIAVSILVLLFSFLLLKNNFLPTPEGQRRFLAQIVLMLMTFGTVILCRKLVAGIKKRNSNWFD